MGDLKDQQPSMTNKEQINNLKEIGLIINDEDYADLYNMIIKTLLAKRMIVINKWSFLRELLLSK